MSDIQIYLLEADSDRNEAIRLAKKTATSLEARQIKLVELIESLGEYLNSEDGSIRGRTMAYLADVLDNLPSKVLTRQHRELLNDFILSRIAAGSEGVAHCARGLRALERLGSYDQERVKTVISTLLEHTQPLVRFKSQAERFEVLRLLDSLSDQYRWVLLTLHDGDASFLPRIISYLDGEKDPRNLMIIFSMLKVLMTEWNIAANAQDLFEAVFNYFPITFRPPPNDPYGVTAQDLKDRLRDCIAATSSFAPYSFPALLDKLDSTSANVKRDALRALVACVAQYGPATIDLYSITLWDAVKFEILNAEEEDLAEGALLVLFEIASQISSSPHETPLQTFLKPVCKECNEHLEDAPTKQSSATGKILGIVSGASAESSNIISRAVLPEALQLYKTAGSLPRRRGLLEVLIQVLKSNSTVFGRWRDKDVDATKGKVSVVPTLRAQSNALEEFSPQILDMLNAAVSNTPIHEVSYRLLALEGIEDLALVRKLLDEDDLSRICQLLDDIIINEAPHGKEEVKARSIDVLVSLARQKPQKIIENAIPAFVAQLPDTDNGADGSYVPILEAFAKLSGEAQVLGTVIVRLKNKLYAALRQGASSKNVASILSAILYAFTHGAVDLVNPAVFGQYYQDIVMPLLKDIIAAGQQNFPTSPALRDEAVYDLIGRICNILLRSQPWVAQTEVCRASYTLFRTDDITSIPPFDSAAPANTFLPLLTSTHLLAALQQQATPHTDLTALLSALISSAGSPDLSPAVVNALLTQIGLLVNKFFRPSQTSDVLVPLLRSDSDSSLTSTNAAANTINLRIAFSVLKALILRIDAQLGNILPVFLDLLNNATLGSRTARFLGQLLAPDPILTRENHCRIYALHRARLFNLLAPQLVTRYRDAASSTHSEPARLQIRDNCLTALTGFVQHVPYDLLHAELASITPLIMQSLALADPEVKAAAITTIARIVAQDAAVLESHTSSLIGRLLGVVVGEESVPAGGRTARAKANKSALQGDKVGVSTSSTPSASTTTTPRTRAAALACLATLPGSLSDASLLPYQRQVVRRLAAALDDRRRAVRAEAVRCRASWAALAGPEAGDGDDD